MYVITGKIGYRTSVFGKHIIRVEMRNDAYTTIDEIVWRDATVDDINNLVLSASLKKRP